MRNGKPGFMLRKPWHVSWNGHFVKQLPSYTSSSNRAGWASYLVSALEECKLMFQILLPSLTPGLISLPLMLDSSPPQGTEGCLKIIYCIFKHGPYIYMVCPVNDSETFGISPRDCHSWQLVTWLRHNPLGQFCPQRVLIFATDLWGCYSKDLKLWKWFLQRWTFLLICFVARITRLVQGGVSRWNLVRSRLLQEDEGGTS